MSLRRRIGVLENGEGEEGCRACRDQQSVRIQGTRQRDGQPYEHSVGPTECTACGRELPVQPIRIERVDNWRSL